MGLLKYEPCARCGKGFKQKRRKDIKNKYGVRLHPACRSAWDLEGVNLEDVKV